MVTVGSVLARIEAGRSVKTLERPATRGELGILRVSAVTWGEFDATENKAALADYEPGDCPRPRAGDILISRANTRELVGAAVQVPCDFPDLLLSDKILRLVPHETKVDARYLLRALQSPPMRRHFASRAGGTSGSMQNITQDDIRSGSLPLPPLPEQRRIADILDKADAVRRKRKEAIALTEELLRSAFLEMFGDPVTNPKGWPTRPLEALTDEHRGITYGIVQRGEHIDDGVPVVRISNFAEDRFDGSSVIKTSQAISNAYRRTVLKGGEILVSIRGTVGRIAVVPPSACGWNVSREVAVVPLLDSVSRPFVHQALLTHGAQSFMLGNVKGVAQSGINIADLRQTPIPVPPPDEISRFEKLAAKIARMDDRLRHSLKLAEDLFSSIVYRAFRGEPTRLTTPLKAQLDMFAGTGVG